MDAFCADARTFGGTWLVPPWGRKGKGRGRQGRGGVREEKGEVQEGERKGKGRGRKGGVWGGKEGGGGLAKRIVCNV